MIFLLVLLGKFFLKIHTVPEGAGAAAGVNGTRKKQKKIKEL